MKREEAMDTQASKILRHLVIGYSITPLEALKLFGCLRLGARIHQLRKERWPVKSTMISINGKRVAQYSLPKAKRGA
jgi:hypothetical protein